MVIGGERELHDGRVKINQILIVLDAFIDVMKGYGIELLLPLRHIQSGGEIENIIGQKWKEDGEQLGCVMSKNYQDLDGSIRYSEEMIQRFLREFAVKGAEGWVRGVLR